MDLALEGKTAIVTGANFGLGRATAHCLAQEGVRVAICSRHLDTIEAAAHQIEKDTNGEVMPFVADVCEAGDIERFVAATTARFGGVDILINNADFGNLEEDARSFFEITDEMWMARINVKLFAAIRFTRLIAPQMMERHWGRIINITGASTRRIVKGCWTKGATQAGVINLTKKLSHLLGSFGITVNAIEPGHLPTFGHAALSEESQKEDRVEREQIAQAAQKAGIPYEEMEKQILARLVIGRRIQFEDTVNLLLFLASDRAATITGEVILPDGGENPYIRY